MKGIVFATSFALFGAACSSGTHDRMEPDGGDGGSDSGIPDAPMLPRIAIRTGEAPALIAYRDEASATWKVPAATAPGAFDFEVAGPYRVVIACADSDGFTAVTQFAQTPADERSIDYPCALATFPFHVRGEMLQEGEVFLGSFGRGKSPAPWTFDLPAAAGTFDLAAFFGSLTTGVDQVVIRRDLNVTGDMDLGTIDIAQEHPQAMVPIELTAPNLDPTEELEALLRGEVGHTRVSLFSFDHPALAWRLRRLPDSVLRPTDRQTVNLMASAPISGEPARRRSRMINHPLRAGGATSLMLMEPLASVAFETTTDRLVVDWTSLPVFDELAVTRESFADDFSRFVIHDLLVTRNFADAVGIASAALDLTDVPGFKPEWRHDPALEQALFFSVSARTSADDVVSSSVSEDLAPPPPAGQIVARRPVDAQRALELAGQHRLLARRIRPAASSAGVH